MQNKDADCCLLVFCGVPGAGKSAICTTLLSHVVASQASEFEGVYVCFDDVERQQSGASGGPSFDPSAWKESRLESLAQIRTALAAGRDGAQQGGRRRLVVADDTMHYGSMRHECRQIARQERAAFAMVWVRAPAHVALRRNASREGPARVPDQSMERILSVFEAPCPLAELDSGQVIVIDTGTASRDDDSPGSSVSCALLDGRNPAAPPLPSSIDGDPASPTTAARLWAAVRGAWGPAEVPPLTPEEQEARAARDRSVTAASLVHGWDVRLRKAVSVHLERGRAAGADAAILAKRLNAARRGILDALREGAGAAAASAVGAQALERRVADFEIRGGDD